MHDEAPSAAETDWRQVLALYDLLRYLASGPMVTLNRVVAVSMVHGPHRGLDQLAAAETDPALAGHHRVPAVRSHLLELADDRQAARASYELAARRTLSAPEQRYLASRARALTTAPGQPPDSLSHATSPVRRNSRTTSPSWS